MQCLLYAPWCPGDLITQKIYGKRIQETNDASKSAITSHKPLIKWHLSQGFRE